MPHISTEVITTYLHYQHDLHNCKRHLDTDHTLESRGLAGHSFKQTVSKRRSNWVQLSWLARHAAMLLLAWLSDVTSLAHQSSNQRRIEHEVASATILTTVFDYQAAVADRYKHGRTQDVSAEDGGEGADRPPWTGLLRDDQTTV